MQQLKFLLVFLVLGFFTAPTIYAKEVEVKMLNKTSAGTRGFEPDLIVIDPGDTVQFIATDKGHSAEQIPAMMPPGAKPFVGKVGQNITVTFDKAGVYGFRCMPHYSMGMVGLIVVGEPTNEALARNAANPPDAKTHFDRLFDQLDAQKHIDKNLR